MQSFNTRVEFYSSGATHPRPRPTNQPMRIARHCHSRYHYSPRAALQVRTASSRRHGIRRLRPVGCFLHGTINGTIKLYDANRLITAVA